MAETIERLDFDSAEEFAGYLLPHQGHWQGAPWVFRGMPCAETPLLPRLERTGADGEPSYLPFLRASEREAIAARYAGRKYVPFARYAEAVAGAEFASVLGRSGLGLPGDPAVAADAMTLALSAEGFAGLLRAPLGRDAERARLPYLALGQHYGLPTCLLDWTASVLMAAYFAVHRTLRAPEARRLAVWAVSAEALHAASLTEVVWLPSQANPNMAQQEGLFSRVAAEGVLERDDPELLALDAAIAASSGLDAVAPPYLRQVTVPACRSPEVWRHLHAFAVDARRAWPGPRGVAAYVRERHFVRHRSEGPERR